MANFGLLMLSVGLMCVLQVSQARLMSMHKDHEVTDHGKLRGRVRKDSFCSEPVKKGAVKFPDSIAGRAKIDFDMYSGYVNITSAPDYLFYWYFGAQDGTQATAPLIVWTNGGPGCTAMEGATTEHGPLVLYDIKEACSNGGPSSKCDYTGQLSSNAFAWNVHANVLYVDQPKNVGYSFGYGSETASSVDAGEEFVTFFNGWLELFPEFKGREVIVAGESYGGHYIPAWINAILNFNEQQSSDSTKINLKGAAIGNGCVNGTVQNTDMYVKFQHEQNLIPASSNPRNEVSAHTAMVSNLGYDPNYYDYRIQSVDCSACYSYNYTAWSLWFLQDEVLKALNVCGDAGVDAFAGSAGGCIGMGAFDSRDNFDYSGALGRALDNNVKVSLYYGKTDTACNYVGGQAMADTIAWSGSSAFQQTALSDWEIAGVAAGQYKSYGNLNFVQVEDAGHMVPMDQPGASAMVIYQLLQQIKKQ